MDPLPGLTQIMADRDRFSLAGAGGIRNIVKDANQTGGTALGNVGKREVQALFTAESHTPIGQTPGRAHGLELESPPCGLAWPEGEVVPARLLLMARIAPPGYARPLRPRPAGPLPGRLQ